MPACDAAIKLPLVGGSYDRRNLLRIRYGVVFVVLWLRARLHRRSARSGISDRAAVCGAYIRRSRREAKRLFRKVADEDKPKAANKVEINNSKFVAAVKTDSLTKSNETAIGKTVTTDDDIQASVSRLAQLKGK